jgi:hypothetical protein
VVEAGEAGERGPGQPYKRYTRPWLGYCLGGVELVVSKEGKVTFTNKFTLIIIWVVIF